MPIANLINVRRRLLPGDLACEVSGFVGLLTERQQEGDLLMAQEPSLQRIWDNQEDRVWDNV